MENLSHQLKYYNCTPCGAYTSATIASYDFNTPVLADPMLRKLRMDAHNALDKLWQDGTLTRRKVYEELAEFLKLDKSKCHISIFKNEACLQTILFATNYKETDEHT